MAKSSASPRSQQRLRVFDYRGRGRRANALWLVYSVKTNRDWILSSGWQLVHGLVFLETEPSVKSFDLVPSDDGFADDTSVSVLLADGSKNTFGDCGYLFRARVRALAGERGATGLQSDLSG